MEEINDKETSKKKVKDWGNGGGLYRGVKANVKTLNTIIISLILILVAVVLYLSTTSSYRVNYEVNGGESIAYSSHKYGEAIHEQIPIKTGYTFEAWYHDKELTKQWDISNDIVKESTTLYAKWMPMSIRVVFDVNEGNLQASFREVDVKFHEAYGELPTPIKEGKNFVGWKYNGEMITSSTIVQMNGEHTLQAMYE